MGAGTYGLGGGLGASGIAPAKPATTPAQREFPPLCPALCTSYAASPFALPPLPATLPPPPPPLTCYTVPGPAVHHLVLHLLPAGSLKGGDHLEHAGA